MNKKLVAFLAIFILFIIGNIIYYNNKTEKVFISGKLFGFDIQSIEKEVVEDKQSIIPTSLKKVGTITFIKRNSGKFAALGHSIKEMENIKQIKGECYNIYLNEIEKANSNKSGKIIAHLNEEKIIGNIVEANNYGLFGNIDISENQELKEVNTASRYEIKKGKAQILTDIKGNGVDKFDIEIESIDYLHKNQNLKVEITSKDLIEKTGGIIQGMSGTPIMQNGKLIGAINYVDSKNPTCAYAIFIDKLL